MSIESVQISRAYLATADQSFLNADLREAFERVEIKEIKRLVKLGANPNVKVSIGYDGRQKASLILLINDKNYYISEFRETIEANCLKERDHEYKQLLLDFISRYDSVESKEQYAHIMFAYEQSLKEDCGSDYLLADINNAHIELYLFEFAVLIKDTDLVKTLLETGAKFEPRNWKEGSVLKNRPFTEQSVKILKLLNDYGYSYHNVCANDEDSLEIAFEARENSGFDPEAALLWNHIKA